MFTLRSARQEDSPAIRTLIRRAGINPLDLDWRRFVVAETADGRLIGCGQIKPHRDGSCELASIAVEPEWQGQGLGRAIVERLLASYHGEMFLTCRPELGPFYEKFGFNRVAEAEMTPYFRRLLRLAGVLSFTGLLGEGILVMRRAGE
jgi:N-acetylglutamate synthase-like GNAT family acetyltransferase